MLRQPSSPKTLSEGFSLARFPLLEIDRKPIDPLLLRGFALDWNSDLTLIQILNCDLFQLDGYAIIRNSDVKKWRCVPKSDFLARAVRLRKQRPFKPRAVTIGSMKAALASAGAVFPLITVHRERISKQVCYVGKFLRANQRSVTIRAISPQAEWEEEENYSVREITLLEFGGVYERLLQQMATR